MKRSLTAFNVLSRLVGVMVIALTLCVSPVHAQEEEPQEETTGLFSPAEAPSDEAVQAAAEDPSVLRYRFVNVDLAQIDTVLHVDFNNLIVLNLFDDFTVNAIISEIQPTINNGYSMRGSVDGMDGSCVTIEYIQDTVLIVVETYTERYVVENIENDSYIIQQNDVGINPGDLPVVDPPITTDIPVQALVGDDTGEQIDIMIVYSDEVALDGNTNNDLAFWLSESIDQVNMAYNASEVNQRMYLVHTEQMYGYSEDGLSFSNVLDQLTDPNDGYLDNVHELRDLFGADIVTLVVNQKTMSELNVCGIAWMLNENFAPVGDLDFSPYAFNVVSYDCLQMDNAVAHETGHNLGANHDRLIDDSPGIFEYSHGYRVFNGDTCLAYTIMAYNWYQVGSEVYTCPHIIHSYSNPNVTYSTGYPLYDTYPTGIAAGETNSANVALTLNNTAITAAQWRDGIPPNPPLTFTVTNGGLGQLRLDWTYPTRAWPVREAFVERWTGENWVQIAEVPIASSTTAYTFTDTGLTCNQDYQYRIRSRGGDGYSSYLFANGTTCVLVNTPQITRTYQSGNYLSFGWPKPVEVVEGYQVERSIHDQNNWILVGTLPYSPINGYNYSERPCGDTYDYRIRAYQGTFFTPYSNIVTFQTPNCAPPPPSDFQGQAVSQSRILLTWVDTTNYPGHNEDGFTLGILNGSTYINIASLPSGATSYSHPGLVCNTSYTFRIRSWNSTGNSSYVTTTASTQPCGPAAPPTELFAQPLSQHNIQISWTDADDETSYSIERSSDGITWIVVGTITADTTAFIDSQLEANTQYYYRVRSANSYSAEPYQYTEPASATTYTLGLFVPIVQTP